MVGFKRQRLWLVDHTLKKSDREAYFKIHIVRRPKRRKRA